VDKRASSGWGAALRVVPVVGKDLLAMMSGGLLASLAGSLALMTMLHLLLFGIRSADPLFSVSRWLPFRAF
jgi:hypothetical protein